MIFIPLCLIIPTWLKTWPLVRFYLFVTPAGKAILYSWDLSTNPLPYNEITGARLYAVCCSSDWNAAEVYVFGQQTDNQWQVITADPSYNQWFMQRTGNDSWPLAFVRRPNLQSATFK